MRRGRAWSAVSRRRRAEPRRRLPHLNPHHQATSANSRFGTLRPRPPGARTHFVVDARGHLLPGVQKTGSAFSPAGEGGAPPRWPSAGMLTLPAAPAATLGYKGAVDFGQGRVSYTRARAFPPQPRARQT
jgi:hypothetical protein